ncbi:MAG: hypothetical protein OIF47_13910 [Marinibacterium sp.]|nr:hypothetical protein [Marinibacterium sp.]
MKRSTRIHAAPTVLWPTALTLLGLTALPAGAACVTDGTSVTCSGDLSAGETIDASGVTSITVDDLTADAGQLQVVATGADGQNGEDSSSSPDAGDGADTAGFTFSFDGGAAYGIDSSAQSALELTVTAGSGGTGESNNITGGDGGDGGSVAQTSVDISDATTFSGLNNDIYYVTAGGAGGTGGAGKNTASSTGRAGDGGNGGDGGAQATTVSSGDLDQLSIGVGSFIYMSSQGGVGGTGGKGEGEGINGTNVHGGDGGHGGDGAAVSLEVSSDASSDGGSTTDDTPGVRVESLGGLGGSGGNTSGGAITGSAGDGGKGGAGGDVTVSFSKATLSTTGNRSVGFLARSYGGGGGRKGEHNTDFGQDGDGGSGGDAGKVGVTFDGEVTTRGTDASGVLVQSVGGFGADAGSSDVTSYGSSDEDGGDGGAVEFELVQDARITTVGDGADGVHAQSVGGSGGKGQSDDNIDAVGGDGSAGGEGGTVSVTLDDGAQISTGGEHSNAVFAVSVGGGGGSGGSASGVSAIGGQGGNGGTGGNVTVSAGTVTLQTSQVASDAIYAASIGGGGGKARSTSGVGSIGGAGGSGGDAGTVTLDLADVSITTNVADSGGVFLQSIGGGGGSGASAVAVGTAYSKSVGGKGGDGGDASTVLVSPSTTTAGSITTVSDRSIGMALQSVGGGGGHGGDSLSVASGLAGDFVLGNSGGGGVGGNGGEVTVDDFYSTISTSGALSHGVLAQSVGGSGGSSGSSLTFTAVNALSITSTVGSDGGDGGAGEAVSLTLRGAISTDGDKAHGITAQSIGGGGGTSGHTLVGSEISGGSFDLAVGGSGGDGGDGGTVFVTHNADLSTGGRGSDGIIAQSIGGGGGNSGWTSSVDALSGMNIAATVGGSGGGGGNGGDVNVYFDNDNTLSVTGHNSVGIRAQSIGGGGGNADVTVTGDVASGAKLTFQTGGKGGDGGDGQAVLVNTKGTITTAGDNGHAILAQSLGQSGGTAALSIVGDVDLGGLSYNAQGNGGDGGQAPEVKVNNDATVSTTGQYASTIIAQSIGGGGGSATGAISGEITMADLSLTLGGSGGSGGAGGQILAENKQALTTSGVYSYGILAQSIGGDGGQGGFAIDGDVSAGEYTGNVTIAVGGDGGDGGTGGKTVVANSGAIQTSDYASRGILAQSIGGSGGNGGSVYSGSLQASGSIGFEVDFEVGGSGGDAGAGQAVTVTNTADITTQSFYADGIYAQSIGGDGGFAGNSFAFTASGDTDGALNFSTTVGGPGGAGAVASDVSVTNTGGAITTNSGSSSGIFAQSVGGNGGQGGMAGTLMLGLTKSSTGSSMDIDSAIAVGGSGGSGGDGGSVKVDNSGTISVAGDAARGIFAQSVGGGGGSGGDAAAFMFIKLLESKDEDSTETTVKLNVSIGGSGGSGGDSDTVTVTNTDTITTQGTAGYGIFAQAVGGGGGNGGDAASSLDAFVEEVQTAAGEGDSDAEKSAFEKFLYTSKDIYEDLYDAYVATKAASITGLAKSLTRYGFDIGGSGGAAGEGAAVTVTNGSDIITSGDSATAIFAQSVGGGGGAGGDASGEVRTDLTVGGQGSGGGNGGVVTVAHSGSITTSGEGAMGIFAQSVGGGGGVGGDVELGLGESFESGTFGYGVVEAGDSGAGGEGGAIKIDVDGTITTTGKYAHGLWAQSVGGSGGAAVSVDDVHSLTKAAAGSAGDQGVGGDITVGVTQDIDVSGDYATALFLQSVGGSDSTGGDITVELKADVSASGEGAWGLFLQSDGENGGGDITVTVDEGASLSVGNDDGNTNDAIRILDAASVTINNSGDISVSSSGLNAVKSETVTTINNSGTFGGSVDLVDDGKNVFSNQTGGVLEVGTKFNLSSDGKFQNSGTLSPGGTDSIIETKFTGTISTDYSGTYLFDLNMGSSSEGKADRLVFEASDKDVYPTGTLEVNLTGSNLLPSGQSGKAFIFSSNDDIIKLTNFSVEDTATVDYSFENDKESVQLKYTVDYTPEAAALTANQTAVGDHMDALVRARQLELASGTSSEYEFIEELANHILSIPTDDELRTTYHRLAPGDIFAATDAALQSSRRFAQRLEACDFSSANQVALAEAGSCAWLEASFNRSERDESRHAIDYTENAAGLFGGLQAPLSPDWLAGLAFGYEDVRQSNDSFSSDGYRFQAGGFVQRDLGATRLSASLSGGYGSYDLDRETFQIDGLASATASPDLWWAAAHLKVEHSLALGRGLRLVPSVDAGATYYRQGAFDESDGGRYQLGVGAVEGVTYSLNPAVELSSDFAFNGNQGTAGLFAGVVALAGDTRRTAAVQFDATPAGGPSFVLSDDADKTFLELGASVQARFGPATTLRAEVNTLRSSNSQSYTGAIVLNYAF